MWSSDPYFKDALAQAAAYPPECRHQSPPCNDCAAKGLHWSQFDKDKGSMRNVDMRTERQILQSIEFILKRIEAQGRGI